MKAILVSGGIFVAGLTALGLELWLLGGVSPPIALSLYVRTRIVSLTCLASIISGAVLVVEMHSRDENEVVRAAIELITMLLVLFLTLLAAAVLGAGFPLALAAVMLVALIVIAQLARQERETNK